MAHYMISYDLHNLRTYKPVWDKLKSCGAVRLLESLWLLTSNSNAVDLRDALKAVIDGDDSIAIIELKAGSFWADLRAKDAGVDWLRKNILA